MRWLSRSLGPAVSWLWTDDSGPRLRASLCVSVVLLLAWGAGLAWSNSEQPSGSGSPVESAVERPAGVDLQALALALGVEVERGELPLGEALVRLHHAERQRAGTAFDLERALARYRRLLQEARAGTKSGRSPVRAVVEAAQKLGVSAYNSANDRIGDSLLLGSANCEGISHLVVSLLHDLGFESGTFLRRYQNHLAPELVLRGKAHHFGLTRQCRGDGTRFAARELLSRFRVHAGRTGFSYPNSSDPCIDPGTVFDAESSLSAADRAPHFWRRSLSRPRGCAFPRLEWRLPRDQLQVYGEFSQARVERVTVTPEALSAQSENIACIERLLAQRVQPPDERLPFLGAAVGHYDRGALLYAAAGQVRLVKELEARREAVQQQALQLMSELTRQGPAARATLESLRTREVWPLVYLGDPGRQLLFQLVEASEMPHTLAALVLDVDSRQRALALVQRLPASEQLELLELLELDNPWLMADLSQHAAAQPLLALARLSAELQQLWRSCSLKELAELSRGQIREFRLPDQFATPLLLELATRRVADRCLHSGLSAELRAFIRNLTPAEAVRVRRELDLIAMLQ